MLVLRIFLIYVSTLWKHSLQFFLQEFGLLRLKPFYNLLYKLVFRESLAARSKEILFGNCNDLVSPIYSTDATKPVPVAGRTGGQLRLREGSSVLAGGEILLTSKSGFFWLF